MYDVEIEESMGRISKDEQRVLNEKAEEIKKIICNEKLSWNQLYPKIVKTIVVTFLELRLDSIFKRLGIPELPDDYMNQYFNRISTRGLSFFHLNYEEKRKMIYYSIYASFFNDNRFVKRPDYRSLDQKYKDLRKKLNDEIVDLNMNLNYKTMLVNIDFPMSLQKKYARLGLFIYKNMMNDKFKSFVKKELLMMEERANNFELNLIVYGELGLVLKLFPNGMFPDNSFWSIFYLFKFDNEDDEIKNLLEFKQNRKLENLIAIRPIFEIKTKNESDSEIITLEDFLEKESVKIEDCQIEINEEYKDPNKTKYKKDYEVDYKDLMIKWYSKWVIRGTTEQLLKSALTSVKMNETPNEGRETANGIQEDLSNIQQDISSIKSDKQSEKKSKVFEGYEHNKRPDSWEDVTICYLESHSRFYYFKDYLRPLRISEKRHSLLETIIKAKDNLILGHYTHNSDLFHRLNEYLRLGFKKEDRPMDWKRYQKVFKVSFNVKMKEEINDLKIILKSPEEIEKRSNDTY